MRKCILFVDDEPKILDSLRDLLRRRRKGWAISLAEGGEEAIRKLKEQDFDIIVTDLRMPKLDGATLLMHVQQNYPHMVRIMLSGYADVEAGLRAIQVAHHFLAKPCELKILENVIERSSDLKALLGNPAIKSFVEQMQPLPSSPRLFGKLTQELVNKKVSFDAFIDVLEQDKIKCSRVVQLVNSVFFTDVPEIIKIESAVSYLGVNIIKNLTLLVELFEEFQNERGPEAFDHQELIEHGLSTARIAMQLSAAKKESEDAFVAALLHDVGKLVIVEKECNGVTHAEIGAYFLDLWGLPYGIVEAVANHHDPMRVPHEQFDTLSAVYVANLLVHEQLSGGDPKCATPDINYLNGLGVSGRLSEWRGLAFVEVSRWKAHFAEGTDRNPICTRFGTGMIPECIKS